MQQKTSKIIIISSILILLILAGGFVYWWYFMGPASTILTTSEETNNQGGFSPLNRPAATRLGQVGTGVIGGIGNSSTTAERPPVLRLLSATPVGGYGASTTASTSVVRWIDRGRGNIYEARGDTSSIATISNTLLPRMYESLWDKNLIAFVGQYLDAGNDSIKTVITDIRKRVVPKVSSTTPVVTDTNSTTYELKGKMISGDVIAVAESPKKDRILSVINENSRGIGYISKFDGTGQTKLFDLPLAQIVAEWPEENTVTITTKAGSTNVGYLYFIDTRTGFSKKVLGGFAGLSTRTNKGATKVLVSVTNNNTVSSASYDIKTGKVTDTVFRTLADKCVWSEKVKENVYCAVPSNITAGAYPDDWYTGQASFTDTIWRLNSNTGEIHKIANLLEIGNVLIDAYNLQIDSKDDFLYFMNKKDLSLWSLDLSN